MRSSGGTNFGFARSVVSRTKLRIACFAGPSFHDGSAVLDVGVSADAETAKKETDKAGRSAKVEIIVRRGTPVCELIGFIFGFLLSRHEQDQPLTESRASRTGSKIVLFGYATPEDRYVACDRGLNRCPLQNMLHLFRP